MADHQGRAQTGFGLAGIGLAVAVLYGLVLAGETSPLLRLLKGQPVGIEVTLDSADLAEAGRLDQAFARMDYRLEAVAGGKAVPPVFLPAVPGDLADLPEIDTKKRLFLRVMLPLVLVVNEEVMAERRRLEDIIAHRVADDSFVADLAARYKLPGATPKALLARVDMVPPSLALAQAAEESGWGTSRFVREANNLFGHISAKDGLVPEEDQTGPRMATFGTLIEAVHAYVHNLNTHPAYERLRRQRTVFRAKGAFPDGHSLAGALTSYSERGQAYVDTIRALIRSNGLLRLDHAKLGGGRMGFAQLDDYFG
jgi:Bax protein